MTTANTVELQGLCDTRFNTVREVLATNDLDARMTVAYVMNLHQEHGGLDARGIGVVRAAYDGLFGENHK